MTANAASRGASMLDTDTPPTNTPRCPPPTASLPRQPERHYRKHIEGRFGPHPTTRHAKALFFAPTRPVANLRNSPEESEPRWTRSQHRFRPGVQDPHCWEQPGASCPRAGAPNHVEQDRPSICRTIAKARRASFHGCQPRRICHLKPTRPAGSLRSSGFLACIWRHSCVNDKCSDAIKCGRSSVV